MRAIGQAAAVALFLASAPAVAVSQTPALPGVDAPARPGVDAPELAALGPYGVGVVDVLMVQPDQHDPLRGADGPASFDRRLTLKVWYPAAKPGPGTIYATAMPGPDGRDARFTVRGLATPSLAAAQGRFPLVILAHGYSNTPEGLAWLGENLATKGYVVAAPAFRDPPISDPTKFAGPLARRPLDVAFVAAEAQRRARAGEGVFVHADPRRTALIGYSMGGYGVLTAAAAPLDAGLVAATWGVLGPYVKAGPRASELKVADVKAVVAISPASRFGPLQAWGPDGLKAVTTPTLFIVGDQDRTVGYDPGVRTLFEAETAAKRWLLTFKEAGHGIGLTPAPPQMRARLWDKDWFEDPVWRKDRLIAIETHFITAFLDREVKADVSKASYLEDLIPESDAGVWSAAPKGRYGGYSPGAPSATLWKGFQPNHATGMRLEFRPPAP